MLPFVLSAVFGSMLVEASLARRNERTQRARGGIEPRGDVYALMRIAYPGLFLAMILEGVHLGTPPGVLFAAGAALFVAAKLLKWWAIQSLGSAWTFRIIVVPGAPLVTMGPYRYVAHPNYLAVTGEFVAVALMTGARLTGPIALLLFGALMLRRIAVEKRALESRSGL
jgi:methyltransferase